MLHRTSALMAEIQLRADAAPTSPEITALRTRLDALAAEIDNLLEVYNGSFNFDWTDWDGTPEQFDAAIVGATEMQQQFVALKPKVDAIREEAYALNAKMEAEVAAAEARQSTASDLENDSDYLENGEAEASDLDDIIEQITNRRAQLHGA